MAPPDDPVLAACKHKLDHFRIKELKDVLQQLGLPKQGKKQELAERVRTALFNQRDQVSETNGLPKAKMVGREMVVKIVEDTFRKMQDPAGTVAASRSHIESGHSVKPKKKSDDSAELKAKVRCPCGNPKPDDPMIKCVDPQCNVRQHVGCVVIPENEKSAGSISTDLPSCFYCELCRVSRADPFWATINNLLPPVLIGPSTIAADGSYTVQYTAKSFHLSKANREMLQKAEYDIQTLLDGLYCSWACPMLFPVLNLVPKEQDGEKFDDALARVRRCVGGGTEANSADSDSDIEVVADSVSVSLRCPMTASRIQIAGRFKPCAHMGCFDLEPFIEMNQRSRKWQCPICLKNYSLENIIIDPYFNRITSLIKNCGDDTSEIDVKPDGSWRVKGRAELKDLIQWHLPDGTLCVATDAAAKAKVCIVKDEIKEEPLSEEVGCLLKLGIRKNSNGKWEISKRGDTDLVPSCDNDHARHMENKKCITLTCGTDDTNIGDEGYNSEAGRNGYPVTRVHDLDSSASDENAPPASAEQDVIVLSDSDDDAVTVLSPSAVNCGSANDAGDLFAPNPPETLEAPFVALKEGFDDLGLSFWERPLSPRDDPTSQMLDLGTRVTDNPGEVDYGGDLGGAAVAANPMHDGGLQPCTSSERDGATSVANLGESTQACDYGHPEKWTAGSVSGAEDCLTSARNVPQKRRNPGIDGSGRNEVTGEDDRSVRARLILSIDSDSDD
ncbi:unnamed protein product [Urochloa decumbens]|uniref:E3 SUMO-protein ligase SIZ1 n=1 Tax=Urochloa decumbens TaxID=240449 RepID=A0ABC9HFN4_9POAL